MLVCSALLCCVLCSQVYAGGQMSGASLKSVDELEDVFRAAGVDVQAPMVLRWVRWLALCVIHVQ
jgi:hypothetical protein